MALMRTQLQEQAARDRNTLEAQTKLQADTAAQCQRTIQEAQAQAQRDLESAKRELEGQAKLHVQAAQFAADQLAQQLHEESRTTASFRAQLAELQTRQTQPTISVRAPDRPQAVLSEVVVACREQLPSW